MWFSAGDIEHVIVPPPTTRVHSVYGQAHCVCCIVIRSLCRLCCEPSYEREGGILGHFLHEISSQIGVENSTDCSNKLVFDTYSSPILLETVLIQIQAHRACGRSCDTLPGLFFRATKLPLPYRRMTLACLLTLYISSRWLVLPDLRILAFV